MTRSDLVELALASLVHLRSLGPPASPTALCGLEREWKHDAVEPGDPASQWVDLWAWRRRDSTEDEDLRLIGMAMCGQCLAAETQVRGGPP